MHHPGLLGAHALNVQCRAKRISSVRVIRSETCIGVCYLTLDIALMGSKRRLAAPILTQGHRNCPSEAAEEQARYLPCPQRENAISFLHCMQRSYEKNARPFSHSRPGRHFFPSVAACFTWRPLLACATLISTARMDTLRALGSRLLKKASVSARFILRFSFLWGELLSPTPCKTF
jgi:hypothetical protein